jgi:phenylacetate-coenzyme A ligase PaaK-like adenylate-forming protein
MAKFSTDFDDIRKFQDRPLNILDPYLIEKCDGIPPRVEDYLGIICHPDFAEGFYDYMMGISKNKAQKIEDLLIRDNICYAIDKSKLYRKKYMKHLNINDSNRLKSWAKNNIKTGEDLELLPSLTNDDVRSPGLEHNAWWVPGKRIAKTFQTGGSTGKPSIIPYSPIDKEVAGLLIGLQLRKNINIKEGDRVLFLAPSEPHPMGPVSALGFERIGISTIPYWKHFKNTSSQEIISFIGELKPDIVLAAPHGPKGATAALDILLDTDQQNGTDILPKCLEGKIILTGGAPISRRLIDELYGTINVSCIINGYGNAHTTGFIKKISREHKEGDPEFSSDMEIPQGYWTVNEILDPAAPNPWTRFGLTVLGREAMPIIKYDPGDYGQVNLTEKTINKICRIEWFYRDVNTGKYSVKIPSQVGTCISGV